MDPRRGRRETSLYEGIIRVSEQPRRRLGLLRPGEVENISGTRTFTCTFRHIWLEDYEAQVCWPLRDQYEPESASRIREVSVSYTCILLSVRDPDADIGDEVRQQARAEHAHAEGDPGVYLIDRLGERDLELSSNQKEETADGPNDLNQRPEEENRPEDERQNPLAVIWKKPLSRDMN
jgi:hypothetical protein